MEKSDHISLTLSSVGINYEDSTTPLTHIGRSGRRQFPTRLRRSWNQLSRCQRNLVILGVSAICVTFLFLLPGDQIVSENNRKFLSARGGVFPFPGSDIQEKSNEEDLRDDDGRESAIRESGSYVGAAQNSLGLDGLVLQKSGLTRNRAGDEEAPIFHDPAAPPLPLQGNIIEEPETLKSRGLSEIAEGADENVNENEENNKIDIKDVNVVGDNFDTALANHIDGGTGLDLAVQNPMILPGKNGMTIDELLNNLGSPADAQKQHFHGATNNRQTAVVAALQHSWTGYKKYAWGHDNLKPISQSSHDWFGLGLTIVDALDTLYIMGLEEEFKEARDWIDNHLYFDIGREVNLFETTIRVLGGLLSAYHLSGDKMFLSKSLELGNRLLPCFLSPSGIPYSDVNLASLSAHSPKWSPDSSTSEVTTIQLEFRDLSRSSGVPIYENVAHNVNKKVHNLEKNNGLVPIFINANTGTFRNYATISLGARGDSYYEYLLKQWIQTGRKEDDFLILDYMRAIDGVMSKLRRTTPREGHVYIGELINGKDFKPKMDHLTCYLPGTLILGYKFGLPESHLQLARDLLETCYQTYMKQPTHLAPEISYFAVNENDEHDIYVKPNDAHNLLRPEFIESLYYFYAITGNRTYQDMGWNIFTAFEKHTKVANGYTSIGNVKNVLNTRLRDMMESFWLGETLKYFYLLFSDNRDEIDLNKWVFNSEAHLLPVRDH